MTTATLRAWPSRDAAGRTNQRVRRDSREALSNERQSFLSPRQRRERVQAFRRHARSLRPAGRRWGSGGSYSLHAAEVLDFLMYHAVQTGRVFPSYQEISAAVGCAYRTAVRCVRQLATGGWLTWERRFVRVGKPGAAEPQVVQTSNLYHLALPTAAGKLIDAWAARRPPPPDDAPPADAWRTADAEAVEAAAVAEAARAVQRRNQSILLKLAAARTPSAVLAIFGPSPLDQSLAKIEAALSAKREFPEGSEARSENP